MKITIPTDLFPTEIEIDDDETVGYVARKYPPGYVYAGRENQLQAWAEAHGYVKDSSQAE